MEIRYFKRIVSFGLHRNQAVDYTDQLNENRSGYDYLMAALLYLPETGIKNISQSFEQSLDSFTITSNNHYNHIDSGKK